MATITQYVVTSDEMIGDQKQYVVDAFAESVDLKENPVTYKVHTRRIIQEHITDEKNHMQDRIDDIDLQLAAIATYEA